MRSPASISALTRSLSLATALLLFLANCGLIAPSCHASEPDADRQLTCACDDCCGNCDNHGEHPQKHHCTSVCCMPMSVPFQYVSMIPQADQRPLHVGLDAFEALPMEPAHSIFHPPRA